MEDQGRSASGAPGRSCTACRRRKIKCDREQPCSYCTKMRFQCIYQMPGQTHRKPSTDDILLRLKNIESSLRRIEANAAATPNTSRFSDSRPSPSSEVEADAEAREEITATKRPTVTSKASDARLVVEEGDTRYVTGGIWTDLEEGEEADAGDDDLLANEIGSSFPKAHLGRLDLPFGLNATPTNTNQLHPTESRTFALWQVFIEAVDPVLKVLHIPTTQRLLLLASQNLAGIPPAFESLMFAIFYAAVTSMHSSVSYQNLSLEERHMMLNRYRIGVEQSLARANFMSVPNVTTLQALVLYLTCARQHVDGAYIWSMTGLLIRLAMKLGLHRDPALLNLPPYMSEMRRRLWWQICTLDARTAEDNDTEPLICEHMYDTRFPSNINDSELDARMTQPPVAKRSRTEMLFTLIRCEITYASRKLVFSPKFTADNGYPCLSVQDKTDAIDALVKDLNEKYLQDYDENIPICFLTRTSISMVLSKVKLTVNHPSRSGTVGISQERLCALFQTAIEIVQYAHGLRSNTKFSKWVWLFQRYIEWDAVAFLLHTMSAAVLPDTFNHATSVIDQFFEDWSGKVVEGDRRWTRLQTLRAKAVARQTMVQSCSEAMEQNPSGMAAAEPSTMEISYASGNNQEPSSLEIPSTMQGYNGTWNQHHLTQQFQPPDDLGLWDTDGIAAWNFDNLSYGTQSTASWYMMADDEMFKPPT